MKKRCQCGRAIVRGTPICLSAPDVCRECWVESMNLHDMIHPNGCQICKVREHAAPDRVTEKNKEGLRS